jgi:hypothetical protein
MRQSVFVTLALVACNVPTVTERPPIAGSHRVPDRIPPSSVHGGFINTVAMAEESDVAVSVDALGEVRLWPTLDGTREPVELEMQAPRAIAIAHAANELAIASIDQAGNGHIGRYSRDGALRGTTTMPGEPRVVQLAAIPGGVLALRSDQTIERYDASGVLRGKLVGDPGERFGKLAARRNGAAVLIASDGSTSPRATASEIRLITIGETLAWGARRTLPEPIDAAGLGLSPSHKRIAVVDATSEQMHVLDAGDMHEIGKPVRVAVTHNPAIGFVDEDDVAEIDGIVSWWPAAPDFTAAESQMEDLKLVAPNRTLGAAVGDKLAVTAVEAQLELEQIGHREFLGWDEDTAGTISPTPDGFELVLRDGHILALDRDLGRLYASTFSADSYYAPVWIDARHLIVTQRDNDQYTVRIVDPTTGTQGLVLETTDTVNEVTYQAALHEVAIIGNGAVNRFALDAAFTRATPLPPLEGAVTHVHLLDPAISNGVIAIAATSLGGLTWTLSAWSEGAGRALEPQSVLQNSRFQGFDDTGGIYMTTGDELDVRRGTEQQRLGHSSMSMVVVPSRDGQRIAALDRNEVSMLDAHGHELWHRTVWNTEALVFSADQRELVLQTSGGLLQLDASTGERLASRCAFGFGLHKEIASWAPRNVPTVCED